MTTDELRRDRFNIVFTALQEGLNLQYKHGWSIFLDGNILYQTAISEQLGQRLFHKSGITATELITFILTMSDNDLKTLFGNIRLMRLQRKLQEGGEKDGEEKKEEE